MAFLTLKDIGKIYYSGSGAAVGIRGVNLAFDLGEVVAITGKSGSGKSTLLNVISGMDSYEEGGYEARSSSFKAGVAERIIEEGKAILASMR